MFAVTAGLGAEQLNSRFVESGDDYGAIMSGLLADRLAEATAEWLHQKVRVDWGFPEPSDMDLGDIFAGKFRSIRPAYGYPACPDHSELRKVFDLTGAVEAGMGLTESNAILPAAGVSGLYFAHPESHYFSVGRVDKEQVQDYGSRKGISTEEAEGLLFGNLGYFNE